MAAKSTPAPNLVNFAQLKLEGTRTVEVIVRGNVVRVTENLEDDPTVDKELGRARMATRRGTQAAQALMSPSEDPEERKAQEAELVKATASMDALNAAVMFDRRRVICARIAGAFVEWNIVGADGKPLPLDFDGLYDGPLGTTALEEVYKAVREEPIVGE